MTLRSRINSLIQQRSADTFSFLEQLVNTDSGTFDKEGVNNVCDMLEARLRAAGIVAERKSNQQYGDHLVARLKGNAGAGGKRVLLVGHMDTVFERGTARARPFTVLGDKVTGPGVHDMKCGLVSAAESCIAIAGAGYASFDEITILFNSDEEVGSPTSRALIEQFARESHACFVLECAYPDGSVVTARKGVGMYGLSVRGVSAHAGADPEKGASAVVEMADKTLKIHSLNDFAIGTTLNVGVVKGGTRRNVIAEQAEAEIDLRVVTAREAERVEAALRDIAASVFIPGTVTELSGGLNRPPMERTEAVVALYDKVKREAAAIGLRIGERATGGASDGNFVGFAGTPIVDGMGPQGGFAHSLDEYMQYSTFIPWVKLLACSIVAATEA